MNAPHPTANLAPVTEQCPAISATCPHCDGEGEHAYRAEGDGSAYGVEAIASCEVCFGSGELELHPDALELPGGVAEAVAELVAERKAVRS